MGDNTRYDIIVVGLGAMGSATAFQLAKRGARVLGIDRFAPPHAMGSSHGKSRIIREAYFEDPRYVPLVRKAYENWEEIERLSGTRIFERTGGLMLGAPDGKVVRGALASAKTHRLPHVVLSAREVAERIPGVRPTPDMIGVVEPRAGILEPETAVRAALELAARFGATIVTDNRVIRWTEENGRIHVVTEREAYEGEKLVIAAGAWTKELVPGLDIPLVVERQTVNWFRPAVKTDLFAPDKFPVIICEYAPGHFWYAFPDRGEGVKLAIHHDGAHVDPETVNRHVMPDESDYVRTILKTFLPAADGPVIETSVCLYTNTPDEHFVIDAHPAHPAVTLISACSGHGFKFASAIGEIVAERVLGRESELDVASFRYRW
jgi:sarcosine oxidase